MLSGPVILASAVRAALENWQFNPVQIDGKAFTPKISFAFVFNPDIVNKQVSTCPMVTGSHLCHGYQISLQNLSSQGANGEIAGTTHSDENMPVKLAVVENNQSTVCQPQDACFFITSRPAPAHRQQIEDQLRQLSQWFAFNQP